MNIFAQVMMIMEKWMKEAHIAMMHIILAKRITTQRHAKIPNALGGITGAEDVRNLLAVTPHPLRNVTIAIPFTLKSVFSSIIDTVEMLKQLAM